MNDTQLLKKLAERIKSEIRTCIPAVVENFDSTKLTVDVKPLIRGIRIGTSRKLKLETGEIVLVDDYSMPSVINVPVQILWFGNGGITFPIKKGLIGTLKVCDRDIRLFKENQAESNQASLRKLNINDAVFEPFLPKRAELTNYNNNAIELKFDNKLIQINEAGINMVGDVNITGNLNVTGEATIGDIAFTTHVHEYIPGTGTPTNTNPPV